jgi:hypothetical protein
VFSRFWAVFEGLGAAKSGFYEKKITFFMFKVVGTTTHIIINHNIAEKTVKTPKKSNYQILPSDFPPKLVGFTVQVYP